MANSVREGGMGAVFAMVFLAFIFFTALFFILLNTALIIVWAIRKRRKKSPRKWWLVVSIVVLSLSVLLALIPVGFIGFLRVVNMASAQQIDYAESGKGLRWPLGEDGRMTSRWFEMDGVKYVKFPDYSVDKGFYLKIDKERRGDAVANIRNPPEASNPFNEFMYILLTGSTTDKINVSTVYPISNDNGFEFYQIGGSGGGDLYCPESEYDTIRAYYLDSSNYDTQNLVAESFRDVPGDNPKDIVLSPGVFEQLSQWFRSDQGRERVEIPLKENDSDEVADSEVSQYDYYEEWVLYAYSKDGMAYRNVYLVLIDGQVYTLSESGGDYIIGHPLPDTMNQYIIKTVFNGSGAEEEETGESRDTVSKAVGDFLIDPQLSPYIWQQRQKYVRVIGSSANHKEVKVYNHKGALRR
jgi:hypothetical protein